jgi:hypothetical protein
MLKQNVLVLDEKLGIKLPHLVISGRYGVIPPQRSIGLKASIKPPRNTHSLNEVSPVEYNDYNLELPS